MTDPNQPVYSPTAPVAPAEPSITPSTKPLAWIALGLAVIGFIFACIPGTNLVAWILLVPAFVIAIIALVQKGGKKAAAVWALILSVVGGIVAVIVSIVVVFAAVGSAVAENSTNWTVEGKTATSQTGIVFTLDEVVCGLPTFGEAPFAKTAKGQFCAVGFAIENGSDEALTLLSSSVTGLIGTAEYEPESTLSGFGDDKFLTTLNPGLSTTGVSVIDVPADKSLDSVRFAAGILFDEGAIVPVP